MLSVLQEMQYYGLTRGRAVSIPLEGRFQRITLDPDVKITIIYSSMYKCVLRVSAGKQATATGDIPWSVSHICAGTVELSRQSAHANATASSTQQVTHCQ